MTKIDPWFIVDVAFRLRVERRVILEGLDEIVETLSYLFNSKKFRGVDTQKDWDLTLFPVFFVILDLT